MHQHPDEEKKRDSQETGFDEVIRAMAGQGVAAWTVNNKHLFDAYMEQGIESCKRNRTIVDKYVSDAQSHDNDIRNVATQALQNAVNVANKIAQNSAETDNMVAKQAVRHSDVAIEGHWDTDIEAVVAKVLAEMATKKEK